MTFEMLAKAISVGNPNASIEKVLFVWDCIKKKEGEYEFNLYDEFLEVRIVNHDLYTDGLYISIWFQDFMVSIYAERVDGITIDEEKVLCELIYWFD